MAEDDRRRDRIQSFEEMQITMTQPGIRGLQQDLVRPRFRDLQRFDRHRLMSLMEDRCAHGVPSLFAMGTLNARCARPVNGWLMERLAWIGWRRASPSATCVAPHADRCV